VYLTFPLSLLAGIGIGGTIAAINNLVRTRRLSYAIIGVVGVIAAVSYLGDIPRVWRADVFMLHEAGRVAENRRDIASELEIANIMTRLSGPSEYVITDNPNAAFRARRLVPPKLVDTSGTRIDAGSLTDALAINTAERYQPPIIVTAPNRMAKLSGFVRWMVDGRYDLVKTYDVGWKVYLRQGLTL
jgi:hypothetical protein